MTKPDELAARKYASRFCITFPASDDEQAMNHEILDGVSKHFLAGVAHRDADLKRMRGTLEGLMQAHRDVFIMHAAVAFQAGDRRFVTAWRTAEKALLPSAGAGER